MKKAAWSGILFVLAFLIAYVALCYLIPGLRLKLAAPPAEYFVESVRHMALFKGTIALAVGLVAAALPWLFSKR